MDCHLNRNFYMLNFKGNFLYFPHNKFFPKKIVLDMEVRTNLLPTHKGNPIKLHFSVINFPAHSISIEIWCIDNGMGLLDSSTPVCESNNWICNRSK